MRLRVPISAIRLLVGVALMPVLVLWLFGGVMVMPPLWVHFYGVGVSALVAAAAALVLMTIGARRGDARTVVDRRRIHDHGRPPRRARPRHARRARRATTA